MNPRRLSIAGFLLALGLLSATLPSPMHGSVAHALDAKAIGGAPSVAPGIAPVTAAPPATGATPSITPAPAPGGGASTNPNASNTTPKPQGTPQTGDLKTRTADGKVTSCNDVPEAKGGKLLGKIVPCLIYTIEQSTITFAAKMVAFFRPLLYSFLTLVVVLFGVRMLQNEPELHKQGFLLLIKITIVLAVLNDLGNVAAYDFSGSQGKLIPAMYDVMNESQAIVAGAIDTTNLSCNISEYSGEQTQPIWAMMDCVLGKLYGFTTGTDPNTGASTTNMLLVSSFFGLLSGFFFGGAWAVVVFFAMIGVLFSIFMMVIRTALGFISSYLILCIMFILTPLLLPLSFLRFTTSYFDNVWRTILSALLTPIIITAYSMFALIVYDKILFAPTSIAQNLFDYEKIKEALQPPRQPCSRPITGKPEELRAKSDDPTANKLANTLAIPFLQNSVIPALGAGNDLCAGVQVPTLSVNQINGFADKESFRKIFQQLLTLFIMAFLINTGLKKLPDLMIKLVGRRSAVSASQSIAGSELDFSSRARDAVNAAVNRFRTSEGSNTFKSGEGFLSGLTKDAPAAARDAGNVILGNKRDKQ